MTDDAGAASLSRYQVLGAAAILTLLTILLTWPQCLYLGSKIGAHVDPYFSTWRMAWVAHALQTDPRHLFDTNIFSPESGTLTFSDGTLLEGVLAAPLFWAGVTPILVYNLMLFAGFLSSGIAMFVLVQYLTRNGNAALVAAAIFTLAPYRIEHFMHLELQWTAWMPLAFWAVHRAVDGRSWCYGLLAGIFVWLQFLSCVYYGIFLGIILATLVVLLIAIDPKAARGALPGLIAGGVLALALSWPYARMYQQSAGTVGTRSWAEVTSLSARLGSYLASPPGNWLWGWTAGRWGGMELSLFPGLTAVLLGVIALIARRPRRLVWVYAAICAAAVELSLGANGGAYVWLYNHVWVLHGLRAPSRFGILVVCGLSVLAGWGFCALERVVGRSRRWRTDLVATTVVLLMAEYASAPMSLSDVPSGTPDVYRVIGDRPPGVTLELPLPTLDRLPGHEALFLYWSTLHWNPLVNGYGGFMPPSYVLTLEIMRHFPDDQSIERLKKLHVRYIVVHRQFYEGKDYENLVVLMAQQPDFLPSGRSRDWSDEAVLFEVK